MATAAPVTVAPPAVDVAAVQRRTVTLLFATQIVGGVGVAVGLSVGAVLAARLGGIALSGVAQSSSVIGGAVLAILMTRVMRARGRRPGLAVGYLAGTAGAVLIVFATVARSMPLLFAGMFLFGGGTAANLQARYTATDLAEPARRGRQLSLVVWATTIGAVAGPNLAPVADRVVAPVGLPQLSGPFAFSAAAFVLAAVTITVLLRPDPLLLSRRVAADTRTPEGKADHGGGMRDALRVVAANPAARLGIASVAMGHTVMVGVMSMTPVHIGTSHNDADTLRIVGIVLSLHIAGMYALAPVVGYLTDKLGRRPVILGGLGTLIAACAVAGTAGHGTAQLSVGLALVGLGWAGTMVGGSTLLTESVSLAIRPAAQGLSDVVMGVAGASAAALAGIVMGWVGYPMLTLFAAIATVPLVALALRSVPVFRPATRGD